MKTSNLIALLAITAIVGVTRCRVVAGELRGALVDVRARVSSNESTVVNAEMASNAFGV